MKKKRTKRNRNGTINKGLEFPSGDASAGSQRTEKRMSDSGSRYSGGYRGCWKPDGQQADDRKTNGRNNSHTRTINQYSHRNPFSFSFSRKLPPLMLVISNSHFLKNRVKTKL